MLKITKKSEHALVLKINKESWKEALISKIEKKIEETNTLNFPKRGIVVDISGFSPGEDVVKEVSEQYKKAGWKVEFKKTNSRSNWNIQQMILK
ncbi:MAG: hypothetical protein WC608_03960 [Parcubacteria group bacterium]